MIQLSKRYCTPATSYFILLTPSENGFKKNRRLKSHLDPKLCQFLYFICDVILEKLLELRLISCIVHHLVEIQDSLYQAKFSINH